MGHYRKPKEPPKWSVWIANKLYGYVNADNEAEAEALAYANFPMAFHWGCFVTKKDAPHK